jgi:circadian clock protein KaiB
MPKIRTNKVGLQLRFYIAGNAPNSVRAVVNARAICDEHSASGHEIEIVDVLEPPRRARADGIIVTPALFRLWALPVQRVISNLSDTSQVLLVLANK